MKNKLVVIVLLLSYNLSISQHSGNGDAEIEDYSIECVVKNDDDYIARYSLLLKINNASGRNHGELHIHYNNLSRLKDIEVSILDQEKKPVRDIWANEIQDVAFRMGLFHTDNRAKVIHAIHNEYPYYVKLEYEIRTKKLKMLPYWHPQSHGNLFCSNASLTLKVPKNINLNYKFYNFQPEEFFLEDSEYNIYTWKAKNIEKVKVLSEFAPPVKLISSYGIFSMSQKDKSISSWRDLGKYYSELIEGLDKLPDEEADKVNSLIAECETDWQKVSVLYKYLQNETRYVGIIEGEGGFVPFSAQYVCDRKFGDCKALTIYMKGLLKYAGINSYYSLIRASGNYADIDTTFVSDQFNHVVLYVPLKNDTIWLECTTKRLPMGYWGEFCDGKTALVCDYENSQLIKTPELSHKTNSFFRNTKIIIEENNYVGVTIQTLKGEFFEDHIYESGLGKDGGNPESISTNSEPQKSKLNHDRNESFSTLKFTTINNDKKIQVLGNNILIEQPYKILEDIGGMSNFSSIFFIVRNKHISDTMVFQLPEEYSNEIVEENVDILNEFGEFIMNTTSDTSGIMVVKSLKLNKGIYPENRYTEFREFIEEIKTYDNSIILTEKL